MKYDCVERKQRQQMSDAEFWDHVLLGEEIEYINWNVYDPTIDDLNLETNCPECGNSGACGYDDIGRPMIHVRTDLDEMRDLTKL